MAESKRIRVVFKDDDILTDAQKSEGLNRSWLLLKPQRQSTVSDVASHLLQTFQLHQSCPQGLHLSISGYALPSFESTGILKENEIIRVRKRRNVLSLEGNDAARGIERSEAVKRQPVVVDRGVLLLVNEEFEKEKGGYESDGAEEDEDVLCDVGGPSGRDADGKKRKRKAAEKVQDAKKKKRRVEAPGDVVNDVHTANEGTSSQKKPPSQKVKQSDPSSEDSEEDIEGSAKKSEESKGALLGMKQNAECQENGKDTEDAKVAPAETKKVASRSARRKYAKRKCLQQMKKIQMENANCESEGLKNWKADHAKSWKSKYEKSDRQRKWTKQGVDTERMEEDGQPKGLLHWKESHEKTMLVKGRKRQRQDQVVSFHKLAYQGDDVAQPKSSTETISKEAETIVKEAIQEQMDRFQNRENGDEHEKSNQDDSINEQTDERNGNLHGKSNQQNGDVQQPDETADASEQSNKEDGEIEVVPIVIRPGHIRFEPLETDDAIQQNHVALDTFQWNGITSKKKGQKWGTEKYSSTSRNDYKNSNKDQSELPSDKKPKQPDEEIDFEKLPPLPCGPKVGDLIAYRLLELSSCWTPELSEFRVGKVTSYNLKSDKTVLVPVPEYPIVSKAEEDEHAEADNSLYKEDGSLEIDFSALIGVRILNAKERNEASTEVLESTSKWEQALTPVSSVSNPEQTMEPIAAAATGKSIQGKATPSDTGNGVVDPWEEISEALSAKKDELAKESSWGKPSTTLQVSKISSFGKSFGKKPKYVQQSPARGKNFKNEQQSQQNSWGKNAKNEQTSQGNSLGKQNSGSKSWSYKALRGSALGPIMSMLRSKNDA